MWDKRRKNIKILTWDKSESSRILASMVWVAIISIAKAIRTAAVNKQLLIDDIVSPWNVHWFEQRMSRSHEIHQFTIRNSSFFNNTAQRKTKRRETTIEDHGRCALYCTATSIGRKRAIATNFKSQRPNGRTVCALPPHARYLKRGKRFFFSSSTKRRNNKQGWRTRRNWQDRSTSRGELSDRESTHKTSQERSKRTEWLHTLFVGRVNDTEDGAELRPLHAWTPVAPTTPPKRVFGIPYCRLPSAASDFPPPLRHALPIARRDTH